MDVDVFVRLPITAGGENRVCSVHGTACAGTGAGAAALAVRRHTRSGLWHDYGDSRYQILAFSPAASTSAT